VHFGRRGIAVFVAPKMQDGLRIRQFNAGGIKALFDQAIESAVRPIDCQALF
jgi:hypothetical protein